MINRYKSRVRTEIEPETFWIVSKRSEQTIIFFLIIDDPRCLKHLAFADIIFNAYVQNSRLLH